MIKKFLENNFHSF